MSDRKQSSFIDREIGRRLRVYRLACKMSQIQLGRELGVTFQQVQKYEKGTNRISGSRITMAAKVLGIQANALLGTVNGGGHIDTFSALTDPAVNRLVRALSKMPSARRRALGYALSALVEALPVEK